MVENWKSAKDGMSCGYKNQTANGFSSNDISCPAEAMISLFCWWLEGQMVFGRPI
jgi:hypothetical protein